MKVLLTGAHGQLGQALQSTVPSGIHLIATGRNELDLSDAKACRDAVRKHRPDWVLNSGAYTSVDQAEVEPDLAYAVNAGAPTSFAEVLAEQDGRLLQISTNFVFNGQQGFPYRPEQALDPLGIYGSSKAAGEEAIHRVFERSQQALILRTSWVIGPVGENFALTMLRLHRERDQLRVVSDQVGCPTSTLTLAPACWRAITCAAAGNPLPTVLHWSDAGAASWYDLAMAVGCIGQRLGLVDDPAEIRPITAAEYPAQARRPNYSLLDCTTTRIALELRGEHWQSALEALLQQVASN